VAAGSGSDTVKRPRKGRQPPPLFPRHVKPLPRIKTPAEERAQRVAEYQAARHRTLAEGAARRLREVKAAFAEGATFGVEWLDPAESWWRSRAERGLDQPDPIRRLRHEWRLRDDEIYAATYRQRYDELRSAFEEGHWCGATGYRLRDYWPYSRTRAALYPGPPTPPEKAARLVQLARMFPGSGVQFDRARRPGGPRWQEG
jgi:hypothetical protein